MATCSGHFRDGRPCTYRAKRDGRCLVHARDDPECPICYSDEGTMFGLACNHRFHAACIRPWLSSNNLTCPVCRAAVGPGVLKRLGVRVDKRLETISRIEETLFENTFSMEELGDRFVRCYSVVLRALSHEINLRTNVIDYLKKRSKNTKAEVKALREEVRKIRAWRAEMALMRPDEDHSEDKVSALFQMHERLQRALAWEEL